MKVWANKNVFSSKQTSFLTLKTSAKLGFEHMKKVSQQKEIKKLNYTKKGEKLDTYYCCRIRI